MKQNSVRRRRECNICTARFTTYERMTLRDIIVIKRSGEEEFFDVKKK